MGLILLMTVTAIILLSRAQFADVSAGLTGGAILTDPLAAQGRRGAAAAQPGGVAGNLKLEGVDCQRPSLIASELESDGTDQLASVGNRNVHGPGW